MSGASAQKVTLENATMVWAAMVWVGFPVLFFCLQL